MKQYFKHNKETKKTFSINNLLIISFITLFLSCEKENTNLEPDILSSVKKSFYDQNPNADDAYYLNDNYSSTIDWKNIKQIDSNLIYLKVNSADTLVFSNNTTGASVNDLLWIKAYRSNSTWSFVYLSFFPTSFDDRSTFQGKIVSKKLPSKETVINSLENSKGFSLLAGVAPVRTGCIEVYVNDVLNRVDCATGGSGDSGGGSGWGGVGGVGEDSDYEMIVDKPGGPIGSGGGAKTSMENHLAESALESIDLAERLKCFQPISTDPNTKYKVTIHVHSARQGYPTEEYWNGDPGHAYITMEKTSGSTTKRLTFGFYPREDTWVTPTKNSVASGIGEESSNPTRNSDIRYTVDISSSDFSNLNFQAKNSASKFYDLNDYNCTDYAIEVFNAAMPTNKKISVPNSNSYTGFTTPAGLYKTLADKKKNGESGISQTSIKAPQSTNCN